MNGLLGIRGAARRTRRRYSGWLASLLVLAVGVVGACTPDAAPRVEPSGATECGPDELARTPDCSALLNVVRGHGTVGVVVTLTTPFTPEGRLDERQRRRQRQAISDAQDELLDELSPYRPQVAARFAATPQLALVVNEAALRALLASRRVARIQENAPQPPG